MRFILGKFANTTCFFVDCIQVQTLVVNLVILDWNIDILSTDQSLGILLRLQGRNIICNIRPIINIAITISTFIAFHFKQRNVCSTSATFSNSNLRFFFGNIRAILDMRIVNQIEIPFIINNTLCSIGFWINKIYNF